MTHQLLQNAQGMAPVIFSGVCALPAVDPLLDRGRQSDLSASTALARTSPVGAGMASTEAARSRSAASRASRPSTAPSRTSDVGVLPENHR
jgi:hypothetical protein